MIFSAIFAAAFAFEPLLTQDIVPLVRIFTFLCVLLLFGCDAFYEEQEIPSYLNIPSYTFTSDEPNQGSASNDILDVWVYVNDQSIGVFEIPFTIPILAKGPSKIQLYAGIKNSGFEAQRENYPFYEDYIDEDFELVPDSIVSIIPAFSYNPNAVFHWIEDFESNKISMDTTIYSNVRLFKTNSQEFEGAASGIFEITAEDNYADLISTNAFTLPKLGAKVYLEMDFNCEVPFEVFLRYNNNDGAQFNDFVMGLLETDGEWKKIYIELTQLVSSAASAETYQIILRSEHKNSTGEGIVLIDNIKLISE